MSETQDWQDVAGQVKREHKPLEQRDAYRMARIAVERIGWPLVAAEAKHMVSGIAKMLYWDFNGVVLAAIMDYEERK